MGFAPKTSGAEVPEETARMSANPIRLGCRTISVNVVDETGKRLPGYLAQPRSFSFPPMVDAKAVATTGKTEFHVRQVSAPVDVWVWPKANQNMVQTVRINLSTSDQTVTLVVNSTSYAIPMKGAVEIAAPQDNIPYDGTTTDASFALGQITKGWRNRAVFDHFKKHISDNATRIIKDNNLPSNSKLSLLAFHSDEIGYFTVSDIGQFQGYTWSGMVLPRESNNPSLVMGRKRVNKLLVGYQP